MSRTSAIARAEAYFDGGGFLNDLTRRVAIPSSSQEPERASALRSYLLDEIVPALTRLGFTCRLLDNPSGPPVLAAERLENPHLVTALIYGHGDTIRGLDDLWRPGLAPWRVAVEGERIYGRGTADNKGQHSVNIAALAAVLEERGALGFNCKILLEMAEELGSVGLREVCATHRDLLKADLLIGSDGPRIAPKEPTIFLGARGGYPIDLHVNLREGSHHSGNWGGLLANAGIVLSQALATITDARGTIRIPEWRPPLPQNVRDLLVGVEVDGGEDGPSIDRDWGEPGLTPPSGYLPGTVSRSWPSRRARRRARSTLFRAGRGRTASSNMWSARRSTTSFRRCGGTSTATAFIRSTRGSAEAAFLTPAVSTRPIRGWIGLKSR